MKKFLSILVLLVFVLLYKLTALSINPISWDLGSINNISGIQALTVIALNNTEKDVKVDFISTCDCLYSSTDSLILQPEESIQLQFYFDPMEESGPISKFMIIRTTQPDLPKALFEVSGEVLGNTFETEVDVYKGELDTVNVDADLSSAIKVIPLKYYYSVGCISCRKFLKQTIPQLEDKLGISFEVEKLNIMDPDIYGDYISKLKPEELEKIKFPALFIGDKLLQGNRAIAANLEQEILNYSGKDRSTSNFGLSGMVSISLIPVILAGLLDGINPCVFSTLLFLISTLTLAGKKRKEILIIGIFFTFAVFITYYLLGLGLFQSLRSASMFPVLADIIKWALILFLLLISVLSFYDYIQIKRGRVAKISLHLPKFLKLKIHGVIREQAKSTSLIIGSLVLGFLVSIFELACTGQVYFPTIAYLVKLGESRTYFYLLVYNISFIIPLFVVFILIYKGAGFRAVTDFFRNNIGLMKVSLSILFLVLAGVVFWM